ncbi:hypothetical protein CEXT_547531 [Caerostris extrusa]|uniref:Uncharacterized protein n=1 Tax=Caerostris extrusa TaxID=172846 RepID=A0AAV4XKL4_CAEEX|nr:hypothetical protein CEXT_547531 [Caerostris extrusa]
MNLLLDVSTSLMEKNREEFRERLPVPSQMEFTIYTANHVTGHYKSLKYTNLVTICVGHSKMRKLCRLSATVAIDNHLSGIEKESNEMPNGLDGLSRPIGKMNLLLDVSTSLMDGKIEKNAGKGNLSGFQNSGIIVDPAEFESHL